MSKIKRLVVILFMTFLLLALIGCSQNLDSSKPINSNNQQASITSSSETNSTLSSEKKSYDGGYVSDIVPSPTSLFEFEAISGGYAITNLRDKTVTNLVLPFLYNDLPIVEIKDSAICECFSLESILIPNTVKTIGSSAFRYCKGLTSIVIPESVTTIDDRAFAYCESLQSITFGSNVIKFGENVFGNCYEINEVTYLGTIDEWVEIEFGSEESNPMVRLGNLYINNQLVTNANLTTATKIRSYAFSYCESLEKLNISKSVTEIECFAFNFCQNLKISVDENSDSFKVVDDILYTKDGKTLVNYFMGNTVTNFVVPTDVETIGGSAFMNCNNLENITLGNNVKTIGSSAFYGCIALKTVTMGENVEIIKDRAFATCSDLTNINLSNNLKEIGSFAFTSCSSLTKIVIPFSTEIIKDNAFRSCRKLTIYCEASNKPTTWDSQWNYSNCTVTWNYKG